MNTFFIAYCCVLVFGSFQNTIKMLLLRKSFNRDTGLRKVIFTALFSIDSNIQHHRNMQLLIIYNFRLKHFFIFSINIEIIAWIHSKRTHCISILVVYTTFISMIFRMLQMWQGFCRFDETCSYFSICDINIQEWINESIIFSSYN